MGERLNYDIKSETHIFDAETVEREFDILEYPAQKLYADYAEKLDIEELPKTKFEKKICQEMIVAALEVLRDLRLGNVGRAIQLRVEDIHIRVEDIHILSPEEYKRINHPEEDAGGALHKYGNAIIPRTENMTAFASFVSHEIAHQIARLKLVLRHENGELLIENKASGLMRDAPEGEDRFHGLMEVINELLAQKIRSKYCQKTKDFKYQKEELVEMLAYPENIWVVEEVFDHLAGNARDQIIDELIRDHIIGKDTILPVIQKKKPEIYQILADMEGAPESALTAAEKLGYEQLAEDIRRKIEKDKKKLK